ncbi:MAG: transcriptional regulator [Candidatus Bathyarchaeota archaeon B24]|nr:MAG: transcriptional regulator [Candidatus Bathyarchaeota archaeon B24]RLI26565.1 MAG: transcriptional regulator [Candidatus Bathyarchaeota archaeon]
MSHVIPDGNVIRRLRKAVGLTQKELARRAGLSQSLISRIERGNIDPRLSTVRKIMRVIEGLSVKGKVTAEQIMHKPVITVKASQPVKVAVELMEKYDISQLPVVDEEGVPIGALQESTLINYLIRERNFRRFSEKRIRNIMENPFPQVAPNTSIQELLYIFSRGVPAVLVMKDGKISGIITKIDLITTILRKQM